MRITARSVIDIRQSDNNRLREICECNTNSMSKWEKKRRNRIQKNKRSVQSNRAVVKQRIRKYFTLNEQFFLILHSLRVLLSPNVRKSPNWNGLKISHEAELLCATLRKHLNSVLSDIYVYYIIHMIHWIYKYIYINI